MERAKQILYYVVTMIFLFRERCYAWRYSDDDDYEDYEKPSNSMSDLLEGLITYLGFFSFYFTVRNVIVFITRGELATLAEATPFLTWGVLFYFYPDMLFKAMFAWGGISIFIFFGEGRSFVRFIGWCVGGIGIIASLANEQTLFAIAFCAAAVLIFVDRRKQGAFIKFVASSMDDVVEMRNSGKGDAGL